MQNLNFNATVKKKIEFTRVPNLCDMCILSVGQKITEATIDHHTGQTYRVNRIV